MGSLPFWFFGIIMLVVGLLKLVAAYCQKMGNNVGDCANDDTHQDSNRNFTDVVVHAVSFLTADVPQISSVCRAI